MEKIYSSAISYYGIRKGFPNTFRFTIRLNDVIKCEELSASIHAAQPRYPYFSVEAEISKNEIRLLPNPRPWVLRNTSVPPVLGSGECNRHLLSFSYENDFLYADCFHGLADARSLLELIKTILFLYAGSTGSLPSDPAGIRLPGSPIPPEEIEDPFLQSFPAPKPDAFFRLARNALHPFILHFREKKGEMLSRKMIIPQSDLMRYCSENDGSPATAVALFAARATENVRPRAGLLRAGLITDLRPALHSPLSHHSTVFTLLLPFSRRIRRLNFEKQGTAFRGKILLENDPDSMLSSIVWLKHVFGIIEKLPGIRLKRAVCRKLSKNIFRQSTFLVSYAGQSSFGSLGMLVEELYTDVSIQKTGVMIELNAVKERFFLNFQSRCEDDSCFRAFLRELDSAGIRYEIRYQGPSRLPDISEKLI